MNVREASASGFAERFQIRGVSYAVNRYYVLSGELRRLGWTGAGDTWVTPFGFDKYGWYSTFEEAMNFEGLGRWYEYGVRREALSLAWNDLRDAARDTFERLAENMADILDRSDFSEFSGERYTAYEEAWFEWAYKEVT